MGATVLLIEDYSAHRVLLHTVVSRMGCRAVDAADGRTGLALAREHQPALIVLDLILPDIDGVEVLRRLREDPSTEKIPVLIVTAVEGDERVVQALDAGADDYVTKPFEAAVLQARMKVLLRAARLQQDLQQRAEHAEAVARIARAAASDDLDTLAEQVAAALHTGAQADCVHLFMIDGERVLGPYGAAAVEAGEHPVVAMLHSTVLGRALCGEVPWQRLGRDELGLLSAGLDAGEVVVVPLRHGRRTVGLAVVAAAGGVRESRLRRLVELGEQAGHAVATGLERAARAQHETLYRLLFDQAGEGVVVVDPRSGLCREVNQIFAGWLSAVPAALIGRPLAALFAPDTASSVSEALSAANHGQRLSLSDLRLQGADGEGIPVELTLRRVRHPGGCDVVAVARDLRSKQALGQSERAIQDLGRLARTVRALNHEINNPLTCIIGLTQLMQLRLKDLPDYLPQLDRILDSAEQINDLSKRLREIAVVLGGEQSLQAIEAVLHDLPASTGT